ncbi:MAG: AsmA family protein [Desulfobulbaceae bacterium]|nr:AsmA family protein [Desulfobulbaceae bacterium]
MYDHSKPLVDDDSEPTLIGKLAKVVGGILLLVAVVLVGLSLFIRFYLTEERMKALIIPAAETALGRTVTLGAIDVGLFSGITVTDLVVKEADNTTNFLSMGRFVLHYDLLPLLAKKLVISEVTIDRPDCRVTRDINGRFNYESLALLAKKPDTPEEKTALPFALVVDRVTLSNAHIIVSDARKELPEIDATASANVGVEIGASLAELKYQGDFDFVSDIVYGEAKPHVTGKGTFDNSKAGCTLTIDIDQQRLTIVAALPNLAVKPLPALVLDVSGDKLNIDRLLAIPDKLPKPAAAASAEKSPASAPPAGKPAKPAEKRPIAASLPPGLDLSGSFKANQAQYSKLTMHNVMLRYGIKDGVASVSDLSFKLAGGTFAGKARVDLTQVIPPYSGNFKITGLQLQELLANLVSPQANILSGSMSADLNYSGAGLAGDVLKKNLNLEATYGMRGAQLAETPISNILATVLRMEVLRTLKLDDIDGNLHLKNGQLGLRSQFAAAGIRVQTDGTVGILDGRLNLPLKLEFSGFMADQLRQKASFLKYLSDKDGVTALNLRLGGTTASPKATLDKAAVEQQIKKQVEEKIKEKAMEEIGKRLGAPPAQSPEQNGKPAAPEPVQQIIKGLFGN